MCSRKELGQASIIGIYQGNRKSWGFDKPRRGKIIEIAIYETRIVPGDREIKVKFK